MLLPPKHLTTEFTFDQRPGESAPGTVPCSHSSLLAFISERQSKQRSPIHWLTPPMPAVARAESTQKQEAETQSTSGMWLVGIQLFDPSTLSSRLHVNRRLKPGTRGTNSKYPGTPVWETGLFLPGQRACSYSHLDGVSTGKSNDAAGFSTLGSQT